MITSGIFLEAHAQAVGNLSKALTEAVPHVRRQLHGRHEQDRKDAEEWLKKWEHLLPQIRS